MHIWNELTQTAGHQQGYADRVGNTPELTLDNTGDAMMLFIPVEFRFCRNPGLALPLIALQYHEVKINLEFGSLTDCVKPGKGSGSLQRASLYVDYIYLDTDERRRFAQVSHEYLIEQLQFTGGESVSSSKVQLKLNFNHPCKELIWVVEKSNANNVFNYTNDDTANNTGNWKPMGMALGSADPVPTAGKNMVKNAKLQLNGHDRFSQRSGDYFNLVQPYQHHTNIPSKGINVYSFGLKPEEHQPSGTCNMSRIDNATLALELETPGTVPKLVFMPLTIMS